MDDLKRKMSDFACQHLCNVNDLSRAILAAETAIHVHKAACIAGDNDVSIWHAINIGQLVVEHRSANLAHLYSEQATKATALITAG